MGKCGTDEESRNNMYKQLLYELSQVFDSYQILSSELYREIYSSDGSYFNIKPEVIVRQETLRQIEQLLTVSELGINVTGTSLSG